MNQLIGWLPEIVIGMGILCIAIGFICILIKGFRAGWRE